jgi:hypothetical protein
MRLDLIPRILCRKPYSPHAWDFPASVRSADVTGSYAQKFVAGPFREIKKAVEACLCPAEPQKSQLTPRRLGGQEERGAARV